MPDKAKQLQVFRKALYEQFDLFLSPNGQIGKTGNKMYGPQPWADLYNYLAEQHVEVT